MQKNPQLPVERRHTRNPIAKIHMYSARNTEELEFITKQLTASITTVQLGHAGIINNFENINKVQWVCRTNRFNTLPDALSISTARIGCQMSICT